ncbi:PilZ domain-containing protein [Erythrobacter sp. HL-111]|uniref:PilZ domain-containing protein n=1 Tax=Erythrobacter sp. HL-111 TaxID=1798193 RepID=UPI0006DAC83C|nr:PilZ domain-containing protein [Erythrobacter sp. HL-111]KPP94089.1 MAG: PilZ domain [Erythrobacteraceae bacterium HL-111]SDS61728.1 PilZ domain-containing protein [Erythrobacter sp. HL-111]
MTGVDTRSVARDSLFLLADLRIEEGEETHRVRVRNLSDGGMMGEGSLRVRRGDRVRVELRNIGPVRGSVAWVQDDRFGVAFDEEIDSQRARRPIANGVDLGPLHVYRAPPPPDPKTFRKV